LFSIEKLTFSYPQGGETLSDHGKHVGGYLFEPIYLLLRDVVPLNFFTFFI
jgi:hypothetical protein